MGRIKCVWCQGQVLQQFRNVKITKCWASKSVLWEQRVQPIWSGATPPFISGWMRRCIHHSINTALTGSQSPSGWQRGHGTCGLTKSFDVSLTTIQNTDLKVDTKKMPVCTHTNFATSSFSSMFDTTHTQTRSSLVNCYCQAVLLSPVLTVLTGEKQIKAHFLAEILCVCVCGSAVL